jgi:dTDP-4-dehydrorhamnose 3,5-epimerase
MNFVTTPLEGLIIIEPRTYIDDRGYFFESYNEKEMALHGIVGPFIQDNQSVSHKGVLRGLHFQMPPHQQGKLVRVARGRVIDVVVDIRKKSKTFGRHFSITLDETEKKMLWIPPGFAHGFIALEENTLFLYKVTGYYDPYSEGGILYSDPELNIDWKTNSPIVSPKDKILPTFKEFRERTAAAWT